MTGRASLLAQIAVVARRSAVDTYRQRALLVFPMLFPLILFAINGSALSAATRIPGFPTHDYRAFLIAIPFVQGAMFVSISAGTSMARDIETGFLNRLALTPLRTEAMLIGQLGGAFVLACVQAVVYVLVGLATGIAFASGVGGIAMLLLLSLAISFGFATLGGLLALRLGSGEAIQGIFPLLFVTLFLSSSNLPRNLIKNDLVSRSGHVQPGLLPARGAAQPGDPGLERPGARAGIRIRPGPGRDLAGALGPGDEVEAGADVRRFLNVARAVAWRSIHNTIVNPAILVPSIIFPLFFLVAFAGGLSRISDLPNFHYKPGYTSFQFVFVFLQSAAFGGVFTGFAVARDFQSGFARRLLLGAPRRSGIIAGYVLGALGRWFITGTIVTIAALIAGMKVFGDAGDLFGLFCLGVGMNFTAALWAIGIAMFLRTEQAGPLIQMPVFVALFLAPVYVPITLLTGWVHAVSQLNPITVVIEAGRGLLAGSPVKVALSFVLLAAAAAVMGLLSRGGLASAERAG